MIRDDVQVIIVNNERVKISNDRIQQGWLRRAIIDNYAGNYGSLPSTRLAWST